MNTEYKRLGSMVSSPSGIRGRALAANAFVAFYKATSAL